MRFSRSFVLGAALVTALACGTSMAWAAGNASSSAPRTAPAQVTPLDATAGGLNYLPITECTEVDTRYATTNPGPISAGTTRDFAFSGIPSNLTSQGGQYGCVVPSTATAIQVVITATGATGSGYLKAWATDQPEPNGSVLSYNNIFDASSAATVQLSQGNLRVRAEGAPTNLSIAVTGYYTAPPAQPEFLTGAIDLSGALVSGTHITSSTMTGGPDTPLYAVTFDRDISQCTFDFTPEDGGGNSGRSIFYTGQTNGVTNVAYVSWWNADNSAAWLESFNLTGICPA